MSATRVGHDLDLGRVVLIGHSAGGHLATGAAGRSRIADQSPLHSDDPMPVAGVINIAGPPDLEALLPGDEQACGVKVIEPLVGGHPDEVPAQYAAASPSRLLPLGVPQLHMVGEEDPIRPFVEAFAARAETAGDDIALEVVAGAGHHDLIAPWSAWWSTVPDLILGFLRELWQRWQRARREHVRCRRRPRRGSRGRHQPGGIAQRE